MITLNGIKIRNNLLGERFGMLEVLRFSHKEGRGKIFWLCGCECGKEKPIRSDRLTGGYARSCGCMMNGKKDIKGHKFGRLMVLEDVGRDKREEVLWRCICECGNEMVALGGNLRSGHTQSCGCLNKEICAEAHTTHGLSKTSEYHIWLGMIQRCHNPDNHAFKWYGARGIKVCDRWRYSFENFFEDMGKKPSDKYTIDRIDNDGDYCPENCKWVTRKEQANNTRSNSRHEFNGVVKNISGWADEYGMNYKTLYSRLERGWFLEKALTTPLLREYKR